MELYFSVLLEGSPGVGKTSLVLALGHFSGHRVVRINLSEQVMIFHVTVFAHLYSDHHLTNT